MKIRWRQLWPWRLLVTLIGLLHSVRISPSALLEGPRKRILLAPGTSLGPLTHIALGPTGKVSIDQGVWLSSDIKIETDTEVRIGARTTIQRRCIINGSTRIGADCILAPDVFISSGTHPFRHRAHWSIREQERQIIAAGDPQGLLDRPVWIQDDCWLGVRAVINPGVTLGKGSVVGANAVVTRDVLPYSVVAGSPARVISLRLHWEPKEIIDLRDETAWVYVLSGTFARNTQNMLEGAQPDDFIGLHVALQMPVGAANVKIYFKATAASMWEINGSTVTLFPSIGSIELAVNHQSTAFGAFAVRLQSIGVKNSDANVIFTSMQILTSNDHLLRHEAIG